MMIPIASIVEGHGEEGAVPALLERLASQLAPDLVNQLFFPRPIRVPRDRLVKPGELEKAVNLAGRKVRPNGAIFVLIDADDSCPATLGPILLRRAEAECGDLPIALVLAKKEYESWFLAAAASLRGFADLPIDLAPPQDPEEVRGAKQWLTNRMPRGRAYAETIDQEEFTRRFDIHEARSADSFDKCCREVERLLRDIGQSNQTTDAEAH